MRKSATLIALMSAVTSKSMSGYYETWFSQCTWDAQNTCDLANISAYYDKVFLAFADPAKAVFDAGDANCLGLAFMATDPDTIKRSVAKLKSKNANMKIYVSVGGASSPFPDPMPASTIEAIIQYVDFYDLDGIDLDFENAPACTLKNNKPSCQTDTQLTNLIKDFGSALAKHNQVSRKKIELAAAAFSVGAYHYGNYMNANPQGSPYAGMWVNPLLEAGHYLDIINIMSYDASKYAFHDTRHESKQEYNPLEAYKAYKAIYKGALFLGVESPPEAWGGNVVTSDGIKLMGNAVKPNANNGDGLFLWAIQKVTKGALSLSDISEQMCSAQGGTNCVGKAGELPMKKSDSEEETTDRFTQESSDSMFVY